MLNLYRKLFWLIPLTAVIMVIFVSKITTGFAADQSVSDQTDTAIPAPKATHTPFPTYTATYPPANPSNAGTPQPEAPQAQGTPQAEVQGPVAAAVPALGSPTPLPDVSTYTNQAVFSFRDMGTDPFTLHFPDIYSFDINLPDRWQISPSQSYLEISYTLAEDFGNRFATRSPIGRYRYGYDRPTVEIFVDDQLAGTIAPEVGDHLARVKLPFGMVEALKYSPTNEHTIAFNYFRGADIYCDYSGVITIHDVSTLNLAFSNLAPTLSLATFPQALVQNSFIPETLLIVIPDDFNEKDLTLVSQISAAIGRLTPTANLKINVIKSSEVSPTLLAKSSAIFIGSAKRNAFLAQLFLADKFVTKVSTDGKTILGVGADEGLLQFTYSDINPNNAYLAITGNSDDGVSKAVSDLAYPPVGMGGLFFIARSGYTPKYAPTPAPDTYRLADLGYRERPVYGIGTQLQTFSFFIPRNWALQDDVKLIITYAHALNLSYVNSGAAVLVNGSPIGSIPMSVNDFGEMQFTFPIKKENFIPGALNTIRFEITLDRDLDCAMYRADVTWFNIRDSSVLYIPHKLITSPNDLPIMHDPVFYLANDPKFVISMPEKPNNQELSGMASFMRILGTKLLTPNFVIQVSMSPKLDPKNFADYNFVVIGKPTRNPFIQTINNDLPQPFTPGQDTLTLQQKIGTYRVEQSIGIGMVQAMAAPWNKMRGVTALTATDDEGLNWVFAKLTNDATIYDFTGELTFVDATTTQSFETGVPLFMNPAAVISGMTGKSAILEPAAATQPAEQGNPQAPATGDRYVVNKTTTAPNLGIFVIIGLVVVGLVIAGFGITQAIRGGRKR